MIFISGSNDQSFSEDDGPEIRSPSFDNSGSEDATTHESHHANLDWRTLRATYVAREQVCGQLCKHSVSVP